LEIEWNKEWEERTGVWRRVWSMGTREAVGNKVGWWSVLVVFDKTAVGGEMVIREGCAVGEVEDDDGVEGNEEIGEICSV
jgi:hypothetical protein